MRFVPLMAVIAFLAPAGALAKSDIVQIRLENGADSRSLTGPSVERQFTIWSGPGTSGGAVTSRSDFVDWGAGAVAAPPEKLARTKVTFYCSLRSGEPRQCYVVHHVHDPATGRGYIYLPGPRDDHYRTNVASIFHDVEGQWFLATPKWQTFMRESATRGG